MLVMVSRSGVAEKVPHKSCDYPMV